MDVLELEPGLRLVVGEDDTPLVHCGRYTATAPPLEAFLWTLDALRLRAWHNRVDAWLRRSENDCLRARGDLRWLAACRAEMMLRV